MRIPDFGDVTLLVAGDVMLDRYWHGDTGRISPEAPVPVVRIGASDDRPGGAANVALGLAALGCRARLAAPVGEDEAAGALDGCLAGAGVERHWVRRPGARTTTKLRVISQHQQMIRLDFEDGAAASSPLAAAEIAGALDGVRAVILSDYAKGALRDPQPLIRAARAAGCPVLVDPKRPDLEAYAGATVITPNRPEFERIVGHCGDEATLVARGRALLRELDIEALLLTRGEEGMTLLRRDGEPVHIPAQAHEVFDVTGAGDTVIAVLAAAVAAGESLAQAAALANLAAGVVVGKLGTATVTPAELHAALRHWAPVRTAEGVLDEPGLIDGVREARVQGQRLVMTNGCFDILHPGHVAYLEAAAALGDRLIVAVNDDDSVRRLKGEGRPVNPLGHRMAVLAGLAAVDWVVPFAEDTPARLIEAVAPDVLVKGGDYRVEDIAGHESVLARGGDVRILPLLEGYSTTDIVTRLGR
ncbi:bifunctional D-glycero-beta-D-manno-heptose-7-phosphate kinase/D-glycero-beta-D-manno-heptose 1-phosphate adenylyltransferase HldE [Arhodomonas aquaeolei]|uniref:bifunctional D-glycero-beta-D-manno-heptose-7-phosphate kinase/D-glycero-beta-D-manno-heptose 1-phosphate adenylyltransferase HldE n=1 Tax=Arhodomonas aquaeolei TaxID=2369 RepID=UPI002167F93F|nr:bifunctional D-glycero-beta-D-manno-heptose-7-phosphate kinase/D-glycero-beta-D-manno-heptose 1-phosphate adenylyltransferase HldE [Arhodomonas aquaeolei]MCS4503041.1 bifunctional D-glycero-beta-D-manno-heptose-7-phosphate kinase/D-glycero-beta-D-manno-heptose 1-phosphate adenylyltransferase HldE [Arhodomonas aquaeolei]